MKPGVIAGLIIVSVILLSMPIALAQEGMWHSAGEVGPGTFLPGIYRWDQSSQVEFYSGMYGDSFKMQFPASASIGLNIETSGKSTGLLVTAIGSNALAAVILGEVRVIGDFTSVGDINVDGTVNANDFCMGGVCLGGTWPSGGGGIGSSLWSENSGNVYRSSGKVGIGTATPDEELEVEGNVHVAGSTNTSEFYINGIKVFFEGEYNGDGIYGMRKLCWIEEDARPCGDCTLELHRCPEGESTTITPSHLPDFDTMEACNDYLSGYPSGTFQVLCPTGSEEPVACDGYLGLQGCLYEDKYSEYPYKIRYHLNGPECREIFTDTIRVVCRYTTTGGNYKQQVSYGDLDYCAVKRCIRVTADIILTEEP